MSFYGCSANVKKLAPPKADLHPLKASRVCKECLCIEWYAKGKTIIPFNTHAGSGDGGTYQTIREFEPGATVKDGLAISGGSAFDSSTEETVKSWLASLE